MLRSDCRVDTWQNATAKRIAISAHAIHVATAWQLKGLRIGHAVSDLCRIWFSTKGEGLPANRPKSLCHKEMRETGLEPARLSTPDPKSGASANSATRAWFSITLFLICNRQKKRNTRSIASQSHVGDFTRRGLVRPMPGPAILV